MTSQFLNKNVFIYFNGYETIIISDTNTAVFYFYSFSVFSLWLIMSPLFLFGFYVAYFGSCHRKVLTFWWCSGNVNVGLSFKPKQQKKKTLQEHIRLCFYVLFLLTYKFLFLILIVKCNSINKSSFFPTNFSAVLIFPECSCKSIYEIIIDKL